MGARHEKARTFPCPGRAAGADCGYGDRAGLALRRRAAGPRQGHRVYAAASQTDCAALLQARARDRAKGCFPAPAEGTGLSDVTADRLARVDASLPRQLQASMERNARLKSRLRELCSNPTTPSATAKAIELILREDGL